MKYNLKLLFILSQCANASINNDMVIKSPETEPTYASVIRYADDRYDICVDNISFSYYAAQKISAEMCQKKINTTKARNKYFITEMNALRCMRQFFAIQPEQFSELTKYDAMCVTLNRLGISSFNDVREKLEQLKIKPSQIVCLDLNFNNLESIQKNDLHNFSNLQVLKVACNHISFLHPKFAKPTKISVLDVAGNKMRKIFKCLGQITLNPKVPLLINGKSNPIVKEEKEQVITFLDQFAHNRYDTLRFFDINPENDELTAAMISAIFLSNEINTVIKKIYLSYFSTDACLQNLIANNKGIIRSDDNVQLPKKYRVSNFSSYFTIKDQIVFKSSLQQRLLLCYTLFYVKKQNNASLRSFVRNNLSSIQSALENIKHY